jgi:ribonucleotide reductase beta subunit family protein with ferritin-like domain
LYNCGNCDRCNYWKNISNELHIIKENMKAAIELDVFQEVKLDEDTGEIIMRPMAEMMDTPLDYIDEEG